MSNALIYAYGVSDKAILLPIGQNHLKYLRYGDLFVFIKDASVEEYSVEKLKRNFSDIVWLEKNTRDHVEVINSLMQDRAVVPFKFGTIFSHEESLSRFMYKHYSVLFDNLKKIDGKEEWSVKIYMDTSVINNKISEISESVRKLETEILKTSPGKAFLLKRKKNELIRTEIESLARNVGQKSYKEVLSVSEIICINHPLSKEMTHRSEVMILNMSCFVKKQSGLKLTNTVDRLKEINKTNGFDFEISGPWPPFSFISMNEE